MTTGEVLHVTKKMESSFRRIPRHLLTEDGEAEKGGEGGEGGEGKGKGEGDEGEK
jgi:hypothetical protein